MYEILMLLLNSILQAFDCLFINKILSQRDGTKPTIMLALKKRRSPCKQKGFGVVI